MAYLSPDPILCVPVRGFWFICALIGVPGVLGGWVNAVSLYLNALKEKDDATWPPSGRLSSSQFFLAQGASGFGGAVAALLVTLWANRFPKSLDLEAWLTLAATGFVSGYVSTRLLPAIADKLYTQLAKQTDENTKQTVETKAKLEAAEAKLERVKQEHKEELLDANRRLEDANIVITQLMEQKANKAEDYISGQEAYGASTAFAVTAPGMVPSNDEQKLLAEELISASAYLKTAVFTPEQTQKTIKTLSGLVKKFPLHRTLHILLARTYTEACDERQAAIETLRQFVKAKEDAGEGADIDTAAAYWNMANYFEALWKVSQSSEDMQEALSAAQTAAERKPQPYLSKLEVDPDFAALRETPEGKAVLEALKTKVPSPALQ